MKEIAFGLQQAEDGWPPFSVEWLWVTEEGDGIVVLHAPFFVKNLAANDKIMVEERDSIGQITRWSVIESSGHSVMWISDLGEDNLSNVLDEFRQLGCNTSVLGTLSHATVDIPPSVSKKDVDNLLAGIKGKDYAIAFPCDRQRG